MRSHPWSAWNRRWEAFVAKMSPFCRKKSPPINKKLPLEKVSIMFFLRVACRSGWSPQHFFFKTKDRNNKIGGAFCCRLLFKKAIAIHFSACAQMYSRHFSKHVSAEHNITDDRSILRPEKIFLTQVSEQMLLSMVVVSLKPLLWKPKLKFCKRTDLLLHGL